MAKSLTEKLKFFRSIIFNSRNADIAPLLEAKGIDAAYLERGVNLYHDAIAAMDLQKKEYQEERSAFDQFFTEKDEVERMFKDTRTLVQALSKNDRNLQSRLTLTSFSRLPVEDWIRTGIEFYNSLLREPEFLEVLAGFNVTVEQLNAEKLALENLAILRNKSLEEKGQAQEATRLRNEKLEELEDYCELLKAVASIALANRPQLMESLGVLVRS